MHQDFCKSLFTIRGFYQLGQILVSVILLIVPALINGYPLLYSDSATYIESGMGLFVPIDRPIFYGLFIRIASMSYSLWFVVILQSLVIVALINRLLSYSSVTRYKSIATFSTVLFLTLFTGVSNYTSQIMPDIFTGMLIISSAMLLIETSGKWRLILFLLAVFASAMHSSNILLITALSLFGFSSVALFYSHFHKTKQLLLYTALLAFSPPSLIASTNYFVSDQFYLTKSSHIFLMGRLVETGCLEEFLRIESTNRNYSLHAFKDNMPEKAWQFIWDEASPLYAGDCAQNGGWSNCWLEKNGEYKEIIKTALGNQHILSRFIKAGLTDWLKQIIDFETGALDKQGENSAFSSIIQKRFSDGGCFRNSKQYHQNLFFQTGSKIQFWTVICCLILLAYLLIKPLRNNKDFHKIRILYVMIFLGLVINAFVCAVLSNVLNRYQGRVVWIIPLLCVLAVFFVIGRKYSGDQKL